MKYLATIINILWIVSIVSAEKNNICKKWPSYFFKRISKQCYFDINARSDVVSSFELKKNMEVF